MKSLVLSHGHPSFSIGGAEVASFNLFQGLCRQHGWESHYLARVGPPIAPHRGSPLMSLRQGPNETLFWANDYDWFYLGNKDLDGLTKHFERFLKDYRPDVVNFHHVIGFGMQALRSVRRALGDVPIVFTMHEYLPICLNHGQMIKATNGSLCSRASPADCGVCFPDIGSANIMRRELFIKGFFDEVDAFVSPSQFLLERYRAWGLPSEKLVMIENGLDGGVPAPARPLPSPKAKRNRFAFFGQLNPFKGIKVLAEAINRIPADVWGTDATLYVFGGNLENQPEAFRDEVSQLFRSAGRRIRFMGPYKAADLPRLMREVDWVVVPSTWWENSPVVIQEAFFHGRPIIASDIGGMAEKIRDGVDGMHFRVSGAESLAEKLSRAIQEPGLWEALRGRIRPPLTADGAAQQHVALFERLLERRGGAKAEPKKDRGDGGSIECAA